MTFCVKEMCTNLVFAFMDSLFAKFMQNFGMKLNGLVSGNDGCVYVTNHDCCMCWLLVW